MGDRLDRVRDALARALGSSLRFRGISNRGGDLLDLIAYVAR